MKKLEGIYKKMGIGAAWTISTTLLVRSIGILSTLILVRLLLPEDFGLVAMATSVIAAIELMKKFSFDVAIIQKQKDDRSLYDTAWTLSILMGVIGALILVLTAPYMASFYRDDRLMLVQYFLALGVLIQSFENTGMIKYRKELRFDKDFQQMVSKKVISFVIGISIAVIYRNYWALVFGMLAVNISGLILSFILHPYRPKLSFSATKELFNFSVWLQINNFLFFLKLRSADFIIGRNIGGEALGIFSISYEISNMPTTSLIAPINRAILPGYSAIQSDPGKMQQAFVDVLAVIFCFAIPTGVGIASTAPIFVPLFFGENWLSAIPIIQILAIFGALTAMQTNVGNVLLASGRPQVLTALAGLYVLLLIPLLLVLSGSYGTQGAAYSYLTISLLTMFLNFGVVFRLLKISITRLFKISWKPLLSVMLMLFFVESIQYFLRGHDGFFLMIVKLLLCVIGGAFTYTASMYGLWFVSGKPHGPERFLIEFLRKKLGYKFDANKRQKS